VNEAKVLPVALLVLRVSAGVILTAYGAQKLFGVMGGLGFNPTLDMFQKNFGIPPMFGSLAIFAEFFGGLGILLGLATRIAGFGAMCTMATATFFQIRGWQESRSEDALSKIGFPLALFAICLCVTLLGAGRYSIDAKFNGRRK
jgi:putative oxidoreductase